MICLTFIVSASCLPTVHTLNFTGDLWNLRLNFLKLIFCFRKLGERELFLIKIKNIFLYWIDILENSRSQTRERMKELFLILGYNWKIFIISTLDGSYQTIINDRDTGNTRGYLRIWREKLFAGGIYLQKPCPDWLITASSCSNNVTTCSFTSRLPLLGKLLEIKFCSHHSVQ